jgi:hypothetical protein
MQRLFAAVLAVTCVVGSTPCFAQVGIANGSGRGPLLRELAPRVPSSENRNLGAQTPQAPNRIQGAPLQRVPGSENRIVGIPLPPAAQAPIVIGPLSQPAQAPAPQGMTGIGQ